MSLINTIACGDCREILPTLPAKSFQLAFADPPYWVGYKYGDKTDKEMEYINPEWLVNELRRVARIVLITSGIRHERNYPEPDWKICWWRSNSMKNNGTGGANIWEPILYYGDMKCKVDGYDIPIVPQNDADFHTCPKSLKLMRRIITDFSEVGDNVLDPTSGSGTTCKAAFELGRNYLGIEIDPKYAELSRQRLLQSQPPLLAMGGLTPRAADGYAASQQAQLFTAGEQPAKVSGKSRRR